MATVSDLLRDAALVKNASAEGENTAQRVGSLFVGIITLMSDSGLSEAEAAEMAQDAASEAMSQFDL